MDKSECTGDKDKKQLSHIGTDGRAKMVNVSGKAEQLRIAVASGWITMSPDTIKLVRENQLKKGDVLTVAEIAGIQGAKSTSSLIPLCHTINLSSVSVVTEVYDQRIAVKSEVICVGQTGVEMEALTAVSVALLTIYDMCKAVDKNMEIGGILLETKTKHDIA